MGHLQHGSRAIRVGVVEIVIAVFDLQSVWNVGLCYNKNVM